MITFKKSEIKIKDYDKYYSDNLNFLESNLNKKIFSYLTSNNKFDASIEIIDEFYKCTDTDSKTYKTLVSFLFSRIGIRNNLSRSGDVNLRSDLLLCDSYQAAIVDIEKGSDLLSPPRNILEQNAIFTSRFKIKNCNNFIVVTNSLPRKRQDYWNVMDDINKVLGIEIVTLSIGALFLMVIKGKKLCIKDFSRLNVKSKLSVRELIGKDELRKIPFGYKGVLEVEK